MAPFLALLEQDISRHPERLQPITADLVDRLHSLVGDLDVDLDGPTAGGRHAPLTVDNRDAVPLQIHGWRLIVLGWVHATDTKRANGSKTDAYRVFRSMLASGQPPHNGDELLQDATQATERLRQLSDRLP